MLPEDSGVLPELKESCSRCLESIGFVPVNCASSTVTGAKLGEQSLHVSTTLSIFVCNIPLL